MQLIISEPDYSSIFTDLFMVQTDKPFARTHQAHFNRGCTNIQYFRNLCTRKTIIFVEPKTNRIFLWQLFEDAFHYFAISHTALEASSIITTTFVHGNNRAGLAFV